MEEISLRAMTRELCHALYRNWEQDPDTYIDMELFAPYVYSADRVDRYFDKRRQDPSCVYFAVMKGGAPVGELLLKKIDRERRECTLSIHMQNDTVKGKGYGTCAERQALQYAFDVLGMAAVKADTVMKNTRSQHVLEKIGFQHIKDEGRFRYYQVRNESS